MEPQILVFVAAVINRLVELLKQALPDTEAVAKWRPFGLLLVSFVVGGLVMVFALPGYNMFPEASSPVAGQILTGILIGGMANGYDWIAGLVEQRASINVPHS